MTELIGQTTVNEPIKATPIEQLTFPHIFTVRFEKGHEVSVTVDVPEQSIRTGMLQLGFGAL